MQSFTIKDNFHSQAGKRLKNFFAHAISLLLGGLDYGAGFVVRCSTRSSRMTHAVH